MCLCELCNRQVAGMFIVYIAQYSIGWLDSSLVPRLSDHAEILIKREPGNEAS